MSADSAEAAPGERIPTMRAHLPVGEREHFLELVLDTEARARIAQLYDFTLEALDMYFATDRRLDRVHAALSDAQPHIEDGLRAIDADLTSRGRMTRDRIAMVVDLVSTRLRPSFRAAISELDLPYGYAMREILMYAGPSSADEYGRHRYEGVLTWANTENLPHVARAARDLLARLDERHGEPAASPGAGR